MAICWDVEGNEDQSFLCDLLAGKPEGSREKVRPGVWLVMGSKGVSYDVSLRDYSCNCPHHIHRLVPGELCRHLKRLIADLKAEGLDVCPACEVSEGVCWGCEGEVMIPKEQVNVVKDYIQERDYRAAEARDEEGRTAAERSSEQWKEVFQ